MAFRVVMPIDSSEQIDRYYRSINSVIGGNTNDGKLWVKKKEDWIAVVQYDGNFYEDNNEARLVQALLKRGYQEIIAVAWSTVVYGTSVLVVPTTVAGIEEFRLNSFCWYVLYAGEPDWFILLAHTLDFIIVAGQAEFVCQVLGCSPDEAFTEIREISESEYLDPVVRRYYAHLIEQLQSVYIQSKPGTTINLGLLNWEESGSS